METIMSTFGKQLAIFAARISIVQYTYKGRDLVQVIYKKKEKDHNLGSAHCISRDNNLRKGLGFHDSLALAR